MLHDAARAAVLVAALLVPCAGASGLTVLFPPGITGPMFSVVAEPFGPDAGNVTSTAIPAEPINGCAPLRQPCSEEARIVVARAGDCAVWLVAEHAVQAGCLGLVLGGRFAVPGASISGPHQIPRDRVEGLNRLIAHMVSMKDFDALRNVVGVRLSLQRSAELVAASPWYRLWHSPITRLAAHTLFPAVALVNLAVAVQRLTWSLSQRRGMGVATTTGLCPCVSITSIALGVETVGALCRTVYAVVDPIWMTHMLPTMATQILITISLPLIVFNAVLITIVWRRVVDFGSLAPGLARTPSSRRSCLTGQLLSSRISYRARTRLWNLSLPLLLGGLLALELASSIPRGNERAAGVRYVIQGATYATIVLIVGVAFAYYGGRVVGFLTRVQATADPGQRDKLRRALQMSRFVAISGATHLSFVLTSVLVALLNTIATPALFLIIMSLLFLVQSAQSLTQILTFRVRRPRQGGQDADLPISSVTSPLAIAISSQAPTDRNIGGSSTDHGHTPESIEHGAASGSPNTRHSTFVATLGSLDHSNSSAPSTASGGSTYAYALHPTASLAQILTPAHKGFIGRTDVMRVGDDDDDGL